MKITKRQLKRIIKKEISEQTHRGNPNKPWDAVFPPGSEESETQEEDPKFLELVEAFRDVIQDANRLGLNEQDIEDAYFSALDEAGFSTANQGN